MKRVRNVILALALVAPVAGAVDLPQGQNNVSAEEDIRQALFEGINEICDEIDKGPLRVYCQDAQFYGYQRFGKIAMSAQSNPELGAVIEECASRFKVSDQMIDYGMAIRCISLNIEAHKIKVQ